MVYVNLGEDELDMLVHDAKGEEAADINNSGRDAQLAYLNGTDQPSGHLLSVEHAQVLSASLPTWIATIEGDFADLERDEYLAALRIIEAGIDDFLDGVGHQAAGMRINRAAGLDHEHLADLLRRSAPDAAKAVRGMAREQLLQLLDDDELWPAERLSLAEVLDYTLPNRTRGPWSH